MSTAFPSSGSSPDLPSSELTRGPAVHEPAEVEGSARAGAPTEATEEQAAHNQAAALERSVAAQLAGLGRLGVAYSGGVDSATLLAVAVRALGADRVVAILGISPSLAADERAAAHEVADGLLCGSSNTLGEGTAVGVSVNRDHTVIAGIGQGHAEQRRHGRLSDATLAAEHRNKTRPTVER